LLTFACVGPNSPKDASAILLLSLLSLFIGRSAAITLDIHLELGQESFWQELNWKLHKLLKHDDIDFSTTALPHVTLYMTDFRNDSLPTIYNMYVRMCLALLSSGRRP
jgi:hypothetical protein